MHQLRLVNGERAVASMGPQLVSCGCGWWSTTTPQQPRFNGAAARELRMPCSAAPRGSRRCRFNGAAARELRMRAAEHVTPAVLRASMGPQLVSCGCVFFVIVLQQYCKLQWGRSS